MAIRSVRLAAGERVLRIEAIRCLKRHLARRYHQLLIRPLGLPNDSTAQIR